MSLLKLSRLENISNCVKACLIFIFLIFSFRLFAKVGRIILPFVEETVVVGAIDVFKVGVFEFSELVT